MSGNCFVCGEGPAPFFAIINTKTYCAHSDCVARMMVEPITLNDRLQSRNKCLRNVRIRLKQLYVLDEQYPHLVSDIIDLIDLELAKGR